MASNKKIAILSILVLLTVSLIAYATYSLANSSNTVVKAKNPDTSKPETEDPNKDKPEDKPATFDLKEVIKVIEAKVLAAKAELDKAEEAFKSANEGKELTDLSESSIEAFKKLNEAKTELLAKLQAYLDKNAAYQAVLAIQSKLDPYNLEAQKVAKLTEAKAAAEGKVSKLLDGKSKENKLKELTDAVDAKRVILDKARMDLKTAEEAEAHKALVEGAKPTDDNAEMVETYNKTKLVDYEAIHIAPLTKSVEAAELEHNEAVNAVETFNKGIAAAELEVTENDAGLKVAEDSLAASAKTLEGDEEFVEAGKPAPVIA